MQRKIKIVIDIAITVLLLMLMAYELIGAAIHEWLGISIFLLFILHHVMNRKWLGSMGGGKYTPVRILQTVLVVLALISMLGSMFSGIILSRHAVAFLPVHSGVAWARTVHLLCGYWGSAFLSLHLGFHWYSIMNIAGKRMKPSLIRGWIFRIAGLCMAVYGICAFIKRGLPGYMALQNQFVFFDFSEPLALFFTDYLCIMALFVWLGHYAARLLTKTSAYPH